MDIKFVNLSDNVRLEGGDVFQMVESTVYFEAYRHILEGLKEVDPARLPLQVRSAFGKHYTTFVTYISVNCLSTSSCHANCYLFKKLSLVFTSTGFQK